MLRSCVKIALAQSLLSGTRMVHRYLSVGAVLCVLACSTSGLPLEQAPPPPTTSSPSAPAGSSSTPPGATTSAPTPSSAPAPSGSSTSNPPTSPPVAQGGFAIDDNVYEVKLGNVWLGAAPGCYDQYRTVNYTRATRTMVWPGCQTSGGTGTYSAVTKQLSFDDAKTVESALRAITYATGVPCYGYDGQEYFMTTYSTNSGEQQYSEKNVNCYNYRNAKISGVYALLAALR